MWTAGGWQPRSRAKARSYAAWPGWSHTESGVWTDEQVKVHLKPPHSNPFPVGERVDVSLPTHISIPCAGDGMCGPRAIPTPTLAVGW